MMRANRKASVSVAGLVAVSLFLCCGLGFGEELSSASYTAESHTNSGGGSTVDVGGHTSGSASFESFHSVGQGVIGGVLTSPTYKSWFGMLPTIRSNPPTTLYLNDSVTGAQTGDPSPVGGLEDLSPVFSAVHDFPSGGYPTGGIRPAPESATAYYIQVTDDPLFGSITNWDSGFLAFGTAVTAGARCADITYAGSPLDWNTTYYWRIKFRNSAGLETNWSVSAEFMTGSFTLDSVVLVDADLVGSPDPEFTNAQTIDISTTFTGGPPADIMLSEDPGFSGASWQSYASPISYTFSNATNELKTVYCKLRNSYGSETTSGFDDIELDTVPPTILSNTLLFPAGGDELLGGATESVDWTDTDITDPNLKPFPICLYLSTNGGSTWPDTIDVDQPNTGTYAPWNVPFYNTDQARVRLEAYDWAGNAGIDTSDSNFTIDSSGPSVPSLASPNHGDFINVDAPLLDWSDSTDNLTGVTYTLEVDDDPFFGSPDIFQSGLGVSEFQVIAPLSEVTWYWQVEAVDGVGNGSGFSPSQEFTIDITPPGMPGLVAPPDTGLVGTFTPTLSWNPTGDPSGETYTVQVDDAATFTPPLEFTITDLSDTWIITGTLPPGTHYWRVMATDGATNPGPWSAIWSFDALQFGIDNASLPSGAVGFYYDVTVTASGGSTPYTWGLADGGLPPGLGWSQVGDDLWINGTPTTAGSYNVAFEVTDSASPPPGYDIQYYTIVISGTGNWIPTPVLPENGSTIGDTTPFLDWSDSVHTDGITEYHFQVATDAAFASIVAEDWVNGTPPDSFFQTDPALALGTKYWRVRAFADAPTSAWSSWSTTYTFNIASLSVTPTPALPTSGYAPLIIDFDATDFADASYYAWDFDYTGGVFTEDYVSGASGDVQKMYLYEGSYTARLQVVLTDNTELYWTSGAGDIGVSYDPGAPTPAQIGLTTIPDPAAGPAPLDVQFTVDLDNSFEPDTAYYEWDFDGDDIPDWVGVGIAGGVSQHTYSYGIVGNYQARIRVLVNTGPNAGTMASVEVPVTVNANGVPPVATISTVNANPTPIGAPVTFTATNVGAGYRYEWDFNGDGSYDFGGDTYASAGTATYTYDTAGTYTAELRVTILGGGAPNEGLQDIDTQSVVVDAPPPAGGLRVWIVQPKDNEDIAGGVAGYSNTVNVNAVPASRVANMGFQWQHPALGGPPDTWTAQGTSWALSAPPSGRFYWYMTYDDDGLPTTPQIPVPLGAYQLRAWARDDNGIVYYSDAVDQQGGPINVAIVVPGTPGATEEFSPGYGSNGNGRERETNPGNNNNNHSTSGNPTSLEIKYQAMVGGVLVTGTLTLTSLTGTEADMPPVAGANEMSFVKAFRRVTLDQPLDNWAWMQISYTEQWNSPGYVEANQQGYHVQEDLLRMYRYNPAIDPGTGLPIGWQLLDNQVVNTAENVIKAWTPLFSDFALGAGPGNLVLDPGQVGAGGGVGGGGGGGGGGICLVGDSQRNKTPWLPIAAVAVLFAAFVMTRSRRR
ncbi:MAG: PKD domain-containing protein [Planctomycetota bacterium]|nr:PKD domain-containing protein [Planctomycetota bacterium]